jgi:hypothetical protein
MSYHARQVKRHTHICKMLTHPQIVDDASSSLEHSVERKDYINANHMMMCRFASSDDEGYIKVKGVLSKYLGEVQAMKEQSQKRMFLVFSRYRLPMNECNLIRRNRT